MDSIKEMKLLGRRLREWRIRSEQTQADFAARIGASIPTLRRMENGDPNTAIRYWVEAVLLLGRGKDIQDILREQRSLFDDDDRALPAGKKRVRRPSHGKPRVL